MTKNISLTGVSSIGGTQVVYMTASVTTDGGDTSVNKLITDKELYNANKVEVRADMNAFEDAVYEVEDEMHAGRIKVGK